MRPISTSNHIKRAWDVQQAGECDGATDADEGRDWENKIFSLPQREGLVYNHTHAEEVRRVCIPEVARFNGSSNLATYYHHTQALPVLGRFCRAIG
jgi:hypothetical protein